MIWLTFDVGTTNLRCYLVQDQKVLAQAKRNIGVRITALTGNTDALQTGMKEALQECLKITGHSMKTIQGVVASGMITSNLGLYEIPHLEAPVGITQLAARCIPYIFEAICPIPIWFIPGIRNPGNYKDGTVGLEAIDFMRGEETESLGALAMTGISGPVLFISPGSHTKYVWIDGQNRISHSLTTLGGELLWAISKDTILSSSLSENLVESVQEEFLYKGMDSCTQYGLTRTCFMVRALHLFTQADANARANFLYGAILQEEWQAWQSIGKGFTGQILIGGRKILRELFYSALLRKGIKRDRIDILKEEQAEACTAIGALLIMGKRKINMAEKW